MSEIDINLLPDYLVEAAEHLEEMESLLLKLSENPHNPELLNEIFRPIHSIKGAAQFVGLQRSSYVAHRLEDLLDLLRKGKHSSGSEVVELLISARDLIAKLAQELENTQTETTSVDEMVARLTAEIETVGTLAEEVMPEPQADTTQTWDIASEETSNGEVSADAAQTWDVSVDENKETSEFYEEDQELFDIYIQNLAEKLAVIENLATELENSVDRTAVLESCASELRSLRSAANYMGYQDLVCIYNNCLEDIDAVREVLSSGEEIPYDFMDGYLAEIKSMFPGLQQDDSGNEVANAVAGADGAVPPQDLTEANMEAPAIGEADVVQEQATDTVIDLGLLPDYLVETAEHLEDTETLLLNLTQDPHNRTILDEIFRPVHSIKGAAQFIGLVSSSRLAHRLEDLLDLLRKGERESTPDIVELLISARDLLVKLTEELENAQSEISSVDDMVVRLTTAIGDDAAGTADIAEQELQSGLDLQPEQSEITAYTYYEEENDQELFGIFLENLREKIDLIQIQVSELETSPDRTALLERCAENLRGLKSAANYMGYDELTRIYENWLEDIAEVQNLLANDEDFNVDFMHGYLMAVHTLFPQLITDAALDVDESEPVQLTANEFVTDDEENPDQAASSVKEKDNLFDKLDSALDAAISDTGDTGYQLLHSVFEEMVSDRENASRTESQGAAKAESETGITDSNSVVGQKPQAAESEKSARAEQPGDKAVIRKSVRVDAEKIDSLINQVGELVVDRSYFFQLFDDMRGLQQYFKDDIGLDQKELKHIRAFTYRMGEAIASLSRTSNELQEGVMKVRMLPIAQLFNRYPRLVHDLTRNNGKRVELKVEGEDTELDKIVVEKLSDPLIHIIRNAIDHGIETVDQRVNIGKPESGTLFLKSYHESNQVVVEIIDDGRGINPEVIKARAVEKGIVKQSEVDRMLPQEVIRLITAPGFSTAQEITDTSGRGVGMDVVRKNIEKLNGTLEIDSVPGKGTSIRLKIPLTLAIIPAHLVRVSGNMYTIPLANIEETLRIKQDETTIIEGTEVIYLRGKTLPVIHLSTLFASERNSNDKEHFFVVVVNTGTQKMGLVVDELLGQEEVVIKPLVDYLRDGSGFSGATIIGDGSISLILDIYEIVNMTASMQIKRQHDLLASRRVNGPGNHLGSVAG